MMGIVVNSGLNALAGNMNDQGIIYYVSGGLSFVLTVVCFFGIKDIDVSEQEDELGEQMTEKA